MKQCYFNLRSVNHEQFPMQMTHITKHNKWLQILAGEDSPPKPLWSENAEFKFIVNNEGELKMSTRNRRAEEQRKHRLAQRRQRRQETEEQRNRRLGLPLFFPFSAADNYIGQIYTDVYQGQTMQYLLFE